MGEESDGAILTKTIEDIQIDVKDCELAINMAFISEIQELLMSTIELTKKSSILSNSQIIPNIATMN